MKFDDDGRITSIEYEVIPDDPVLFGLEYPPDKSSILRMNQNYISEMVD